MTDHSDKTLAEIAKRDERISYRQAGGRPKNGFLSKLIGRPLASADAPHETIGKTVGLALFASDALSSTAYATQEILVILALAGLGAFSLSIPLSLAITSLLIIVTLSYVQTLYAYPSGGGAYIVARDNLGQYPALVAGAALLLDYVLTVAVSVSAGAAQLVSAIPSLFGFQVEIAVFFVLLIMVINLRGVRESGFIFAIPTYLFILVFFVMMAVGFAKFFSGTLATVVDPPELELIGLPTAISGFLILRAFASGTAALTGIEAISNGITAFKEPRSRNAAVTMLWMGGLLAALFLGITFLSHEIQAIPSEVETVISQLGRTVFEGRGPLYISAVISTTVILFLAANTAFAGFPRLGAIIADSGYLPRQLNFRGSRLVYSRGIALLAIMASLLIIGFRARVTGLIPLYAIGVFLSFTLSQAGMTKRWMKSGLLRKRRRSGHKKNGQHELHQGLTYDPAWLGKMILNGFGAVCTGVVMFVFAYTKFRDGAWVVLVVLPTLVLVFLAIQDHYKDIAGRLSLQRYKRPPKIRKQKVIIPVSGMHRGTIEALRYAQSLSKDVTAVHVAVDAAAGEKLLLKWQEWAKEVNLVVLGSPYRLLYEPLLKYIKAVAADTKPNEIVTVVVPEFVPRVWWHGFLHARAAQFLRLKLLFEPDVVIVEVPYVVD